MQWGEFGGCRIKTGACPWAVHLNTPFRGKNPTEALKTFALSVQQAYQD